MSLFGDWNSRRRSALHPIVVYKKFGPFLLVPRSQIPNLGKMAIGEYKIWQEERRVINSRLKSVFEDGFKDPKARVNFDFMLRWAEAMVARSANEPYIVSEGLNGFLNIVMDPHTHYYPRSLFEEETQTGKVD